MSCVRPPLLALRPGGYHACTLLGKLLLRRPMFRYATTDLHPSGWVETRATGVIDGAAGGAAPLSPEGQRLLRSLAEWGRTNRVRVCHALPVAYCRAGMLDSVQRSNARFLLEVSQFLPVLEDRRLGVNTNASLFADTGWHFTAAGIAQRSDELAEPLRAWRMWKLDELRSIATNGVAPFATP